MTRSVVYVVKKKWVLLVILLLLSGCWDRKELEKLAIVTGIGIDYGEEGDDYQVSFQIARSGEVKTPGSSSQDGGGGGGGSKSVWLLKSKGATIFDAVRNATLQSSRRLFLSHNQVVIINKEVAEKGLLPVIDFLIRDHEPRLNEWLLITREQAETILSLESGLEKISALAIADLMRNYYLSSKIRAVNLHEFAGTLLAKTTENTLPIIGVVKTDQEKGMVIEETGIFKSDKLIGYLNKKETRGLLWVLGKTQDGVVVVELPGEEGKVSLEIFGAKSKISSKVSEGKIRFEIDIAEVGSLGEQTSYANLSSREKLSLLENLKAKVIVEEVEAALKKAQECKADIFGLGEYLQRQNRKEWEKVKDNWGELFPHLEVKVKVKTKIRWLGLLTKPTILEQIK